MLIACCFQAEVTFFSALNFATGILASYLCGTILKIKQTQSDILQPYEQVVSGLIGHMGWHYFWGTIAAAYLGAVACIINLPSQDHRTSQALAEVAAEMDTPSSK